MRFDERYDAVVASWVRSDQELTWLAPGTRSPLTPAKVRSWGEAGGERLICRAVGFRDPVGYAELHRLPRSRDRWWIGHCIVDPALRRIGLGRHFVNHLLVHAFDTLDAEEVLLVVFPENRAAIRCYERCGFIIVGRERRYFKAPAREHVFLRMAITRGGFQRRHAMTASGCAGQQATAQGTASPPHPAGMDASSSFSTWL